jgi:6-phosphogluconolactonase/glucosamine-6-phosphate isomerase/deaminase
MHVLVTPGSADLAVRAADWIQARSRRGDLAALAVGGSVRATYAELARRPQALAGVRLTTIDELHPIDPQDPRVFSRRLRSDLGRHGELVDAAATFRSDAPDADAEALRVQTLVDDHGLGVCVLGLGPNGHLAINEPGVPFDAVSRHVPLIPGTLAHLGGAAAIAPATGGMTLSLATLLSARDLLLVVDGPKEEALHSLVWGPLTPDLPASILRLHGNVTVMTTEAVVGAALPDLRRVPGIEVLGHRLTAAAG